eukprot:SAG25_NODE_1441_length_3011_cov_1.216003_2_plen_294_part_00
MRLQSQEQGAQVVTVKPASTGVATSLAGMDGTVDLTLSDEDEETAVAPAPQQRKRSAADTHGGGCQGKQRRTVQATLGGGGGGGGGDLACVAPSGEGALRARLASVRSQLARVRRQMSTLRAEEKALEQREEAFQHQLSEAEQQAMASANQCAADWEHGSFEWDERVRTELKRFRVQAFRPLQRSVVNATLSRKDVLVLVRARRPGQCLHACLPKRVDILRPSPPTPPHRCVLRQPPLCICFVGAPDASVWPTSDGHGLWQVALLPAAVPGRTSGGGHAGGVAAEGVDRGPSS